MLMPKKARARLTHGCLALLAGMLMVANPAEAEDETVIYIDPSGDVLDLPDGAYVVMPGDTLWEISQRVLGNAEAWPRLWSINDDITNPHWIYPGNRLIFKMAPMPAAMKAQVATIDPPTQKPYTVQPVQYVDVETSCGPDVRFDTDDGATRLTAPGFLANKDELEVYGKVYKANVPNVHLAEGNQLYLHLDDPDQFGCGDVLSIFRLVEKRVRHPHNPRVSFGSLYEVVGEVRLVHQHGDVHVAHVRDSWSEINRGDLVGPAVPVALQVDVGPPMGDLDGTILTNLSKESSMLTSHDTIFLDRGKADGVRVGDTFFVIAQQDPAEGSVSWDGTLPPRVIGRTVVVRVGEYASTAVITDASQNISVGDDVTMSLP